MLEFVVAHASAPPNSSGAQQEQKKLVADETEEQQNQPATKATKQPEQQGLASPSALTPDDLYVCVFSIDYGMKDLNPVDRVGFYNKRGASALKDNQITADYMRSNDVWCEIPKAFSQTYLRLYLKPLDVGKLNSANQAWQAWLSSQTDSDEPRLGY